MIDKLKESIQKICLQSFHSIILHETIEIYNFLMKMTHFVERTQLKSIENRLILKSYDPKLESN